MQLVNRVGLTVLMGTMGLVLVGCGTERYEAQIKANALESAPLYQTVCLIPSERIDPSVNKALVDAMEAGVRDTGSDFRLLGKGEGPQQCQFTIGYDIEPGKTPNQVVFYMQTFKNGVPLVDARAPSPLSANAVKSYVARLIDYAKRYEEARRQGNVAPIRLPSGA